MRDLGLFGFRERTHGIIKAVDGDFAIPGVHGFQQPHQGMDRVHDGAAESSRMGIAFSRLNINLQVTQTAEPDHERRLIFIPLTSVRTEDQIAGQAVTVGRNKFRQLRAADLLLTFKKTFKVDRQPPGTAEQCFHGQNRYQHIALVVGSPPGINAIVFDRRLKRRPGPQIQRINRLCVKMSVNQNGGFIACVQPIAINDWMPTGGQHLDIFDVGGLHPRGNPLRCLLHVFFVFL